MVQKEELAAAAGRIASDINNVEANVFDPEAVVTKEYSANAIELAKHYVGLNDYEGAIRVFNAMAPKLTESGQGASMLASITDMATEKGPATIIYMTRKLFERVKKNVNILAATGFAEYPKMTPELAEEITRRVDDIKTMDNPVAKEQATKDMWRMICNKIPPSASSWIDSFRYSNVIGERAIGTNIMNNAMDQFIVYPSTKIGAALSDSVRSVGGKKREHLWGEVPIAVGHQMKGLVSGIKSALRVLGNIEDISHPDTRGYGEDYAEVYRSGRRQTRVPFPYDIRIRIMDAFDRISSNMLGRAELDALNYRESKAVQVDNKQQRVDRMVQEMFYRRPVDPKGKKSGQGHLFRIMDIPMQYLTKLQNDTSSWQAKVAGSALKLPVMFVRMSTSLAKLLIEYSPAGVATIPGSADKSLQISKAFIGSLIYVWAAAMSSTHDTVTTLSRNKTARAEELEAGLIPWSIKIGGKYRSFVNFGPFGMALAVTAIYKDIFKKGDPTESQKMKMLKAVGKTLQYYGSMTANKGVNDMTNALLGQEYAMANALTNPIRQFTPWASSMRTVQQIIDPYYRDPGMDVWDSWKANMPYLSESTPPLLTGAGNKVYRQYRAGNALLPWATSEIRDQDLYNSVQGRKLLNVNQSALDRIKEDMRRGKINRADINARTKKLLEYNKRNRMNQ